MNRFLIALAASSLSLISNAQAPQYAWHKTFGGTIAEAAIGNDGYVYVIGTWTGLRDFDPGPGTLNLTSSASGTKQAVFFGRFTQTGDLVWIKSLPSAAYASYGVAITTDADNNLLLLLQSNDNDFDSDAGDGVVQHLLGESYVGGDYYAGIVARYDVDGNYLWSQPIIREGYTGVYVEDVVTDGTYVYVTGSAAAYYWGGWVTYGDGPDCGCYLFTPSGFSAEDAGFAVAWALDNGDAIPTNTGISTGFGKKAPRIAFDDLNYRYVLSYSSYFSNSGADLIKFEPFSGLQSWSRNDVLQPSYYIENIFTLNVTDMHVDNDYNIYIAGTFGVAASYSMQVNTTPVTNLYTTAAYDTDLFVVKTDPIGYGIAAFSIPNGSAYDNCYAFELNKSTGDIFVGGSLYGTADFDPGAGVSNLSGDTNYNDTYVAKYTSDLGLSFVGLYDAASGVFAMPNHLLINEFGELLVCGRIDNGPIDVDLTGNTVNVITPSSNYGLLVSYASCGAAPAAPGSISGAAEVCAGNEYVYSIAAVAEATSYNWSLPAGWSGSSTGTSIVVNPGANSGTISVSAHNPCGTSSAQQIVVSTYSPPVVAQTSDNEVCVGQTVTLTGSGASSYAWNNGVTNGVAFAPSSTTTYTVTGTDANGCEGTADVTVTVNSLPNVSANASDASVCAGQSVTLYGSGAQSYTWNLGVINNVAFVPVQTTTYTVTGTDGNGCTDTGQIEVTVNALPVVDANAVDDSVCEEDMVTLYGSGASTYVWNNGVNNNEPFMADVGGTYTVTGTDNYGCQDTDMITITVYALPDVNAMVSDESVCSGSAVTFSGSGAVTYQWDNGVVNGVPFVPAGPGTFTVTGTDSNGCTDTDDITITMLPSPPVLAVATNATVCDGNFVTLTGSGALSYTWSNGVTNGVPFAPTATGSYTVTGLGGNGCSASDDILITVNELPDVVANASTPVVCAGNELILFGTGAESYVWSGGVTDGMGFVPVASNNYTVTGTDNNGCSNADVIFVEVVLIPVVEANASSPFVCLGNDVTLSGSGAATYNWNNGVTDGEPFSPVLTATYTVVGIDENGCSGTDQITLEVYTPPVVTANANTVEVCAGGEVVLYGSGALEYQWSGGAIDNQPFQPAASGNFIVTGADEVGCIDTDEIYITVNQLPVIAFSLSDDSLCTDDGPLILNATPMGGSFFGTGVSGNVFTPTGLAEGSYNISYIYTDALGCTGQDIEQVWVDICDAINESALQPQWSLWPNPAEDKVWVEWNGGDASMQIFGANGEEVMTLKLKTSQFLNLESFATGIYFVVVSGDGFHTTKKLLID